MRICAQAPGGLQGGLERDGSLKDAGCRVQVGPVALMTQGLGQRRRKWSSCISTRPEGEKTCGQ